MVAQLLAAALPMVAQGITSFLGSKAAKKQEEIGRQGVQQGTAAQISALQAANRYQQQYGQQAIEQARAGYGKQKGELERYYGEGQDFLGEGQGYLAPYRDPRATELLYGAAGVGEEQDPDSALAAFRASPRGQLLQQILDEETRQQQGVAASQGLYTSGAMREALARRLAGVTSAEYGRYETPLRELSGRELSAAGTSANISGRQAELARGMGGDISRAAAGGDLAAAQIFADLGTSGAVNLARQGEVSAYGPVMEANLGMRRIGQEQSYLADFAGAAGSFGSDLLSRFRTPSGPAPNPASWQTDVYQNQEWY